MDNNLNTKTQTNYAQSGQEGSSSSKDENKLTTTINTTDSNGGRKTTRTTRVGNITSRLGSVSLESRGVVELASAGGVLEPTVSGSGGGGGSALKRVRANTTTPPSKPEAKRPKVNPSPHLSTADLGLQVLVKAVNGTLLTPEMAKELLKTLYVWLDGVPRGSTRPIFSRHQLLNGAFVVHCVNRPSVDWLINAIKEIDTIGSLAITAVTADSIPPKRKMVFTISDPDTASPEVIFKRLGESNLDLHTVEWVYISKLEDMEDGRSTHLIAVDQMSVDFLMKNGKKMYYMYQHVYVRFSGPYIPGRRFGNRGKSGGRK